MAAGEFAEPIYELIEEISERNIDVGNSHEYVLGELIAYLSHDSVKDFVEYFRREHDMGELELEEDDTDTFDPYDFEEHECKDETTIPTTGSPKYFSSLIPEC